MRPSLVLVFTALLTNYPAIAAEPPIKAMDAQDRGDSGDSTPVTIAPRPAALNERIAAALAANGPDYRPPHRAPAPGRAPPLHQPADPGGLALPDPARPCTGT